MREIRGREIGHIVVAGSCEVLLRCFVERQSFGEFFFLRESLMRIMACVV